MNLRGKRQFKVWYFGLVLLAGSVIVLLIGIFNRHLGYTWGRVVDAIIADFYPNIATELMGIAVTILIIDRLYEQARNRQEKNRLIRQMGSRINL